MNLASKKTIKEILKEHGVKPTKMLGQNFLIDKLALKKIIETAQLKPRDTVLEIGPGIGTLTQAIAEKAGKVIAVEKDAMMVQILGETLKRFNNVEIIKGDILKLNLADNESQSGDKPASQMNNSQSYKIVANLPFYLTAIVIRKFLEADNPAKEMTLIVQKEVGQRICANPPRMNLLAVSVQFYAEAKIISYIAKESFWPQPKVDAVVIKIVPSSLSADIEKKKLSKQFFKIVKAGFSHPRKQLLNNFLKAWPELREEPTAKTCPVSPERVKLNNKEILEKWLKENNIKPSQRAESLTVQDWINLAKTIKELKV